MGWGRVDEVMQVAGRREGASVGQVARRTVNGGGVVLSCLEPAGRPESLTHGTRRDMATTLVLTALLDAMAMVPTVPTVACCYSRVRGRRAVSTGLA